MRRILISFFYLQQLEAENTRAFATKIFRYDIYVDTYVDNILSGADTIALATEKMQQLQDTLTAGFNLKKWIANSLDLLVDIPVRDQDLSAILQAIWLCITRSVFSGID